MGQSNEWALQSLKLDEEEQGSVSPEEALRRSNKGYHLGFPYQGVNRPVAPSSSTRFQHHRGQRSPTYDALIQANAAANAAAAALQRANEVLLQISSRPGGYPTGNSSSFNARDRGGASTSYHPHQSQDRSEAPSFQVQSSMSSMVVKLLLPTVPATSNAGIRHPPSPANMETLPPPFIHTRRLDRVWCTVHIQMHQAVPISRPKFEGKVHGVVQRVEETGEEEWVMGEEECVGVVGVVGVGVRVDMFLCEEERCRGWKGGEVRGGGYQSWW